MKNLSFCENSKKKKKLGGGRGEGSGWDGCQGGCKRRIEVFVKIAGGGGGSLGGVGGVLGGPGGRVGGSGWM